MKAIEILLEEIVKEKCPMDYGANTKISNDCNSLVYEDVSMEDMIKLGICQKCWESEIIKNDRRKKR